jgi:galactokinase
MMDPKIERESLFQITNQGFAECFGGAPTHVVSSPGRLNVIGEHVDYNDGIVLPAAIERWIVASFSASDDGLVRIFDKKFNDYAVIDPKAQLSPEKKQWTNYPKGVIAQFQKRGTPIPGFKACIYSNVPSGGGLSSSAALEALFATIIETLNGDRMDLMGKALLCQKAEHEYAGVPCGIMDQAAVILGKSQKLLQLDCRDLTIQEVPFASDTIGLMIIDSSVHHELASGEYRKRRESCESAAKTLGLKIVAGRNSRRCGKCRVCG